MRTRNGFNPLLKLKFDISGIEHEIKQMEVDLEYFQQQGLLIRQAIEEKENTMRELFEKMNRFQDISKLRRDYDE